MGDRANVYVHDGDRPGVYLYTHWAGSELPATVVRALQRGQGRWNDDQYLARIILCEMVKGDEMGETGYGISAECGDGSDRIVDVDTRHQTIRFIGYDELAMGDGYTPAHAVVAALTEGN